MKKKNDSITRRLRVATWIFNEMTTPWAWPVFLADFSWENFRLSGLICFVCMFTCLQQRKLFKLWNLFSYLSVPSSEPLLHCKSHIFLWPDLTSVHKGLINSDLCFLLCLWCNSSKRMQQIRPGAGCNLCWPFIGTKQTKVLLNHCAGLTAAPYLLWASDRFARHRFIGFSLRRFIPIGYVFII